jgi:hypothetical protein
MATVLRYAARADFFQSFTADNDAPAHDVASTDSTVSGGLHGIADATIDNDNNASYSTEHKVQAAGSEAAIGSGSITQFIWIKHTGFTTADKDTATTSYLTIGIGGAYSAGGFGLEAGGGILLERLGAGSDNLSEIQLDSSSGDIYVEVVYM